MNTNIYMFSHTLKNKDLSEYENNDFYNSNYLVNNLPSCNKIAKIIKVLMINFPEFSKQYFIDYLMKPSINIFSSNSTNHDLELISQKINEVNSQINATKAKINEVESEKISLEVEFERRISYANIELEATEMGMQKKDKSQVKYIRTNENNTASIKDDCLAGSQSR